MDHRFDIGALVRSAAATSADSPRLATRHPALLARRLGHHAARRTRVGALLGAEADRRAGARVRVRDGRLRLVQLAAYAA